MYENQKMNQIDFDFQMLKKLNKSEKKHCYCDTWRTIGLNVYKQQQMDCLELGSRGPMPKVS